jgi:hypothetical protein
MSKAIVISFATLAFALPLTAQSGASAANMEAGVYRAVIQQHGGTTGAVVFRTIEDGDLCWTKLVSTECITAAEKAEFGSAVTNFLKVNPMPQKGSWSDETLKAIGVTVSDTVTHNCSATHFGFSRVGFDPAQKVAVVRYTATIGMGGGVQHCGSREAGTYLLKRNGSDWTIVRRVAGTVRP